MTSCVIPRMTSRKPREVSGGERTSPYVYSQRHGGSAYQSVLRVSCPESLRSSAHLMKAWLLWVTACFRRVKA